MNIFIKLEKDAKIPTKGSPFAAGYDIYSNEDCVIPAGERKLVGSGFRLEMPLIFEYYFRIAPRSGLACKGIDVGAGICDADYRGEVKILLINNSKSDFKVSKGDRIAQGIFEQIRQVFFNVVSEINDTQRGEGGFGSTGVN